MPRRTSTGSPWRRTNTTVLTGRVTNNWEQRRDDEQVILVKIYKSSHHHGIIWSGTNTISRASSSFQMEIRSAKRWKIGRTFAELIRKCAKDGSGKRLSGKVSRKPHHENNMSQCVKMENKLSFWFSEQRDEGLREQGANNLKIFALMNHSGHDV